MEKKEQPKTESSLHHYRSTEQTEVTFSVVMMKRLQTTTEIAYEIDKHVKAGINSTLRPLKYSHR